MLSCSEDAMMEAPEVNNVTEQNELCYVTVDLNAGADSRLALSKDDKNIKSVWSENDGFTVVKDGESTVHTFSITDETVGSSKGVFVSKTTPTEGRGYNVYYPASITNDEEFGKKISLRGQEQVGDGNMDHLAEKITMRHNVAHYSDIRFINQEYSTIVDHGDGSYSEYGTPAGNLYKSTIWKLVGTNLPVDFQPVSMELEVSNSNCVTFMETNGTYNYSGCLKASMALKKFDKDKDFEIYMVQSYCDVTLPKDASLRLTVRDASGECYYSDKVFTETAEITGGTIVTFQYSGNWKRGNNHNYESTDYADEGKVVELQRATGLSSGMTPINIVFMGDGFSDRQIKDGTYEAVMKEGYKAFFSEEPYTSFKNLFNVYYVVTASKKEGILDQTTANESTFGSYFGAGTAVGGNNEKVLEYTRKVESLKDMDEDALTSIVMLNSSKYAGTCYYSIKGSGPYAKSNYGMGYSVSYFPIGSSYEALRQVLTHEANGHGFGKLADEYDSGGNSSCTEVNLKNIMNPLGWHLNIDTESDPTKTIWQKFYDGEYKTIEGIGAYAGAYTWPKTNVPVFYRPTDNSIMNRNVGGFNAPSREAIYIRIHKMVNGKDWKYNESEFKNWDKKNIKTHSVVSTVGSRNIGEGTRLEFVPLAPPVITFK